jgi:hypothetical protein
MTTVHSLACMAERMVGCMGRISHANFKNGIIDSIVALVRNEQNFPPL